MISGLSAARRVGLLVVAWALMACQTAPPVASPATSSGAGADPASTAPVRIVSLAPALTSMLFRLGLGPQVVGVTRFCDDPPDAARLPRVGGFADANLEAVMALRPDLIVAVSSPPTAGLLARAEEFGVRTLAVRQDSLASTWTAFEALGAATGRSGEAAHQVALAREALPRLSARAAGLKGKRVLFVYGRGPLVLAGPGSYGDELLALVGAVNAAGGFANPWPKVTAEELVGTRPDIILDASVTMEGASPDFFTALPGLEQARVVPATHPGLLQPGPRVVEGIGWLAETFP